MEGLVINANPTVSLLCYSVLRVEPYNFCSYSCTYCYRAWAARKRMPRVNFRDVVFFKHLAEKLQGEEYKLPVRLSTLCEPFQPAEEKYRLSLRVLKYALRYQMPIIVSTKSTLPAKKPWIQILSELASKQLLVVQYTILTFSQAWSSLEPKTPSPQERLDAAGQLSDAGIPLIIRVQPVIPGVNDTASEFEELMREASKAGFKQAVIETIRTTPDSKYAMEWYKPYHGSKHLVSPPTSYKYKVTRQAAHTARMANLKFSGCKEGFLDMYNAENCCGLDNMEGYSLRITIRDIYRRTAKGEALEEAINNLLEDPRYVESNLKAYPKPIRKKLRKHHNMLIKCLQTGLAAEIAPTLQQATKV